MIVYTYTALIILYILSVFIDVTALNYAVGVIAVIAAILASTRSKGLYFYSGLIFLLIGTGLFLFQEIPWYSFFLYFDSMLGVMSLFLVLPFLNSIIRVGHYDTNLNLLLRRNTNWLDQLYKRSFLVSHVLGLFLNIAMIPLLKSSLHHTLKQLPKEKAHAFLSQSLLRSYALCLSWSPMEVLVSASLDMTGKAYYEVLLPLVMIVFLFAMIDYTLSFYKYRPFGLHIADALQPSSAKVRRKILEMVFMLFIFILLTSLFQHYFQKGYLLSVVIVIIPVSIIWALLIKKQKRYFSVTIPYWKERSNGLSNYFFMFLSAGLFVNMLSASGALSFLQTAFSSVSDRILIFYFMIGLYFFVASLIGFHPLVSITLLGELLRPILPAVSSIPLTIVLITCSLATVMYSPFNLSVSILSDLLRINPIKIMRWNLPFALMYIISSILIAYGIGLFL
ncbi:hypothetical protein [Bacillus sp. 37MA]|uniref:hypothetical protein n=1 Tax=Bacillus sp. 37MA TaxID=1132442 RepID=UPI000377C773|nr:hypothetical protein [Bacillus sp. 37MA]